MTTRYTVYHSNSGEVQGRGLSVTDAAHEILTYDGYLYEIRIKPGYEVDGEQLFEVYRSRLSRNSSGGPAGFVSCGYRTYAQSEADAWPRLADQVVQASYGFTERGLACMTDEDYDRAQAEIAADA